MPPSYPGSAKTFTTKTNGPGQTIDASHINDLQLEVTAIEQDLIAGLPAARGGTGLTAVGAAKTIPQSDGSVLAYSPTLDISSATGGQIVFPAVQNPSANANTLDDYEEGTWTPSIGGSGGQSGQTYTVRVGRYVKVGKKVTANFYIELSALGTVTNSAQVQGLPFATENVAGMNVAALIGYWTNFTDTFVSVGGLATPNATAITLYGAKADAVGISPIVQADLANTSVFGGSITYLAAA